MYHFYSDPQARRFVDQHTSVRFRAPPGARGWVVRGCFGEKIYSILFRRRAALWISTLTATRGSPTPRLRPVRQVGGLWDCYRNSFVIAIGLQWDFHGIAMDSDVISRWLLCEPHFHQVRSAGLRRDCDAIGVGSLRN